MTKPTKRGGQAQELSIYEIKRVDRCLVGTRNEERNRAMFYLGLGSGMRVSELCGLSLSDVRRNGDVVDQVVLDKHRTKSKRSRTVFLSQQAHEHLRSYVALDQFGNKPDTWPLFGSEHDRSEPLSVRQGGRVFQRMFEAAGLPHASSHSLRRTHANALRRAGADLKLIQNQLGHADLGTTSAYLQVDPSEQQAAVTALRF